MGDSKITRSPRPAQTAPIARDLGDLGKLKAPPSVVAGSTIRVGITIKDWSAEAIARHPDPDRWTHVTVDLFCEHATPSRLDQSPWRSPHLSQTVTHDGQRFEWTFQLPDNWGAGKEVYFIFGYTDERGFVPQYSEPAKLRLVLLPAA